ncbi:MAG TPA: AAA family ATPase [Terriglobales bacterium]|nr:AAA family ATPase [Terriglobales bacterium]
MKDIDKEFVHLARLALEGKTEDVAAIVRRSLRDIGERRPDLADDAKRLIAVAGNSPLRSRWESAAVPVDIDSRLELLRREDSPDVPVEPIWPEKVAQQLEAVLDERAREGELVQAGLTPSKSLLFVGPPGVGKTLAARWLAKQVKRPLMTLDLSAVMSSFLGKTGNNIRVVLDYAQRSPSVLLLDEFDAIAKRRDDAAEIGELKRLVTVLVQAVDDWPTGGLLIAATNHPELLDPAVWRRFDRIVEFPLPTESEVARTISGVLADLDGAVSDDLLNLVATTLHGRSFAEVTREVMKMRRAAVLKGAAVHDALLGLASEFAKSAPFEVRIGIARELQSSGSSQRQVSELTGLSRDTIRKHLSERSPRKRRNGAAR